MQPVRVKDENSSNVCVVILMSVTSVAVVFAAGSALYIRKAPTSVFCVISKP